MDSGVVGYEALYQGYVIIAELAATIYHEGYYTERGLMCPEGKKLRCYRYLLPVRGDGYLIRIAVPKKSLKLTRSKIP